MRVNGSQVDGIIEIQVGKKKKELSCWQSTVKDDEKMCVCTVSNAATVCLKGSIDIIHQEELGEGGGAVANNEAAQLSVFLF